MTDTPAQRSADPFVLAVSDLRVQYGRSAVALHGIDLQVSEGDVVAVLGSNGAGKSTLLRAISGTLPLHQGAVIGGSVRLGERRINNLDPADVVRMGVVGVPEGRQVFARMSVHDNLRAGGIAARSTDSRERAQSRVYELFPILERRAKQLAGLLSGGEQQMLAIGRALMSDPRLLLLDEPSLGLAPKVVTQIGAIVGEINSQGTAVVLVEQNAHMALKVAARAVVLEAGHVALAGSSTDLAASEEVRQLYLGGHDRPVTIAQGQQDIAGTPASRIRLRRWVA